MDNSANLWQVNTAFASLYSGPSYTSSLETQLLYGEYVYIDAIDGYGWATARAVTHHYPGYIHSSSLTTIHLKQDAHAGLKPDIQQTFIYAKPDIKTQIIGWLPYGACLTIDTQYQNDKFIKLGSAQGFVFRKHVVEDFSPLSIADMIQNALLWQGTPYRWGGRTAQGIDCSGFVQLMAAMVGVQLPRNSGDQEIFLKKQVRTYPLQAGNLVFWKGHVGMMLDEEYIIHASGACMKVVKQKLTELSSDITTIASLFI